VSSIPTVLAMLVACIALEALGCASKRLEDGVFRARTYHIAVPEGWQVASSSGADLTLSRPGVSGAMLVNSTCEGRERSFDVLMLHLLIGLRDRHVVERAGATVNGYPAERAVFEGASEGGAVRGEAYVVKAASCVYDLLYVAPRELFDAGRQDFGRFVQSLRVS